MTLHQLLTYHPKLQALMADELSQLTQVSSLDFKRLLTDSRQVQPCDVFVLLKSQSHTHQPVDYAKIAGYLEQVAGKAVFVLSEMSLAPLQDKLETWGLVVVELPKIRTFLGTLVQASLQLSNSVSLPQVVAVTGTNGKTTISQLTAQLVNQTGKTTAVMGTAGNGILPVLTPSTHTTPDALVMQQTLYEWAQKGVEVVALEASSHGLHQHRLQGVPVEVAIFSNLSRDHLDYHTDMDDYANSKAMLFDKSYFEQLRYAIVNLDDEYAPLMIEKAKAAGVTVWTYALNNTCADFFAKQLNPSLTGVKIELQTPKGIVWLDSPLLGRFNVANVIAALAAVLALDDNQSLETLAQAVTKLQGARGRMQKVATDKGCFIVDYAHTPDALIQVLTSLKAHCTGKLWAVFGCGGDRDKGKRPLMAKAGVELADKVILTADNPRSEDPLAILKDMQVGLSCEEHYKLVIEPDRKQAIAYAITHAKADDIVVIAGKGHETYQEIQGVRHEFDDVAVIEELLKC